MRGFIIAVCIAVLLLICDKEFLLLYVIILSSGLFIAFVLKTLLTKRHDKSDKTNSNDLNSAKVADQNERNDVAVVKLSLQQYQSIQQAVIRGRRFCEKISKDTKFREAFIESANNPEDISNYGEEDFVTTLKFFLVKDFFECFGHLGHDLNIVGTHIKYADIDYTDPTGQALFAMLETMVGERTDYRYFREAILSVNHKSTIPEAVEYRKTIEKAFSVYLNSGVNVSMAGTEDFNLVIVLLAFNKAWYVPEIRKIYYQFAQAVALSDNDKDGTEAAWLHQLQLKIAEDSSPKQLKPTNDEENVIENDISTLEKPLDAASSKDSSAKGEHNPKMPSLCGDPVKQLDGLVGLTQVKSELESLSRFIEISQKRREAGLRVAEISYHCVFAGNPGTGKTTVARILAGIYRQLGILSTGQLVETDRSGLVAEYVGQTAIKTNKIIDKAIGGVLFVDEAYTLAQGGDNDYGKEAIATLLKRMEDDRDKLVVVLAGYNDEIEAFINSNPGLRSRFNRYIHFQDYSENELLQIFLLQAKKYEYNLDEAAQDKLRSLLHQKLLNRQKDFGNARYVRNLFERVIENQAVRLSNSPNFNKDLLSAITEEDIHE